MQWMKLARREFKGLCVGFDSGPRQSPMTTINLGNTKATNQRKVQ